MCGLWGVFGSAQTGGWWCPSSPKKSSTPPPETICKGLLHSAGAYHRSHMPITFALFRYALQLALLIGRGLVLPMIGESITWYKPNLDRLYPFDLFFDAGVVQQLVCQNR